MLKKLDKLLIRSYIGPLLATFFVSEFLLLMQFLWKYIDDMVGKGLAFGVIAELLMYTSASLVPMALPLSVLLASIMAFGNLGEYNELIAIKASGISLQRIMRPLFIFNFFIAVMAFLFANNVMPYTNLKMHSLLYDVRHQRPELNIKKGVYYKGIEDFVIKIKDKDPDRNMLYDIMIYDHRNVKGNLKVTVADSAEMKFSESKEYLLLSLFHGATYEEVRDKRNYRKTMKNLPAQRQTFNKQVTAFKLDGFGFKRSDISLFKNNYQMMNVNQLSRSGDSLARVLHRKEVRFYKRLLNDEFMKMRLRDSIQDTMRVSLDSIWNALPTKEKGFSYANAIGYARNVKNNAQSFLDDNHYRHRWYNKHQAAWHGKFTIAVACLLLFLIGAPLGAIVRKGGFGVPVVISVVIFIFYYIFSMTGEKYVKAGEVEPIYGMWFSPFLVLTAGLILTYRAAKEAKASNFGTIFVTIWHKLMALIKKKNNTDGAEV